MASNTKLIRRNMRIFGMPPQFTDSVDVRFDNISNVGNQYLEHILLEAPILTIMPGEPYYLPGVEDKTSLSATLLESASSDFSLLRAGFANQAELEEGEVFRYYDFQPAYTEFMSYVNILARTMAGFLELRQTIDGSSLQQYDWKKYSGYGEHEWIAGQVIEGMYNYVTADEDDDGNTVLTEHKADYTNNSVLYQSSITNEQTVEGTEITNEAVDVSEGTILDMIQNYNYIQFYVDMDNTGVNETMSNETAPSQLKSAFEGGSNLFKELQFVANSGGAGELTEELGEFLDASVDSFASKIGEGNTVASVISRLLNVGTNVVRGENVIMPDIYQSSTYSKSYNVTIHLKAMYGTKFGWFMGIGAPLAHLLALAIPRQTTANTYGSPFLVKMFMDGVFVCNLGIVSEMSINRSVSEYGRTLDGLPSEVDVNMTVVDLYSDLTMSPQHNPLLFINNTSLVEYLAINCGLNLITPQLSTKVGLIMNTIKNAFFDVPNNAMSTIKENMDNMAMQIFGFPLRGF